MRSRRTGSPILGILIIALIALNASPAVAQDWISASSQHYRLIGTADDDDLQEIGARLEGFYTAMATLFRGQQFRPPPATTIIVLDDDDDVEELGLTPLADGYFFAGASENYIILSPESRSRKPFEPILHDFFHSIARENLPDLPVWMVEGLAEFYSTIGFDDDQLTIGAPIETHIRLVRDEDDRLPFAGVFATEADSDLLNELDRDQVFYAQSWGLIHFLMLRNRGPGLAETAAFVHMTAAGMEFDQAFPTAFSVNFDGVLEEFSDYVRERSLPFMTLRVEGLSEDNIVVADDPFSAARAETYIADLLIQQGRSDEGERRLEAAIAREPGLSEPHTSLGGLRIRQERYADALELMETAIEGQGPNYLTYYNWAVAFSRLNPDLTPEQRTIVRERLSQSIALRETFADSYHELAVTYVDAADDLDEAARLLDRALTFAPEQTGYLITLSRVLIAQDALGAARSVLERVLEESEDPAVRERAQSLLDSLAGRGQGGGLVGEGFNEITSRPSQTSAIVPEISATVSTEPAREPIAPDDRIRLSRVSQGDQHTGLLSLIDCRDGLTLTVTVEGRELQFHTRSPDRVEFATFTSNVGQEISCGPLDPPAAVVVTYLSPPEGSEFAGVPLKIEFVDAR